ncbi:hypothetical protein CICLE_v10033750mg [Citrus x clementina]|uniref:Uncharacterized protein n=1 Tax=Citrus clementina TaxID=85681 RepID=V4TLS3_CITCL|nr:hypothetical protein CICLE_v10033750mg [Citrus x clementina]
MIHGHDGDDDAAVELLCTATVTVTVDASTASAAAATANNSSLRSHTTTHAPRQAIPIAAAADHAIGPVVVPISVAAGGALSGSLMRHNAAVIELGSEDAAIMSCGLEAAPACTWD